jgi:hypothetical protein
VAASVSLFSVVVKLSYRCPGRRNLKAQPAALGVAASVSDMGLGEHLIMIGRILFPVQIRGIMMDLPNFTPHVCVYVYCQCPAH